MNKKILIGSIIAVVILVLVSFTGVVGYQTTKSSTIARASPLFSVRSSRAIDEESKEFTYDYVGKGEEINLKIPKRYDRIGIVQNFINRLSKMDDKTLDILIDRIINRLYHNEDFRNLNVNLIVNILKRLINNPEDVKNYENNNLDIKTMPEGGYLTTGDFWYPGCSIIFLLFYLYILCGMLFFLVLCKFAEPPTFEYSWYAHN